MLRLLVSIVLLLWGLGTARSLYDLLSHPQMHQPLTLFALGFGLYFILWFFWLRHRDTFWSILEHEITHAIMAMVFRKKIRALKARRAVGGSVIVDGGNIWIALAPYFLPLPALLVAMFTPLLQQHYLPYLHGMVGFLMGFHVFPLLNEFHLSQPDIQQTGVIVSILMTMAGNLFFFGIIVSLLSGEWQTLKIFIGQSLMYSVQFASTIGNYLRQQVLPENIINGQ